MVPKRVKDHYLRSYEQFYKNSDLKGDFLAQSVRKNRKYQGIFEYTKIKKVDQKMGYQHQKVQEKKNSKNGVKTIHSPLFKELREILEKPGL